uniref:Uncharacterized protein n=1 Tax=Anopheles farauti TaxID=69004 RepID=A0A182QQE2_9DIPT
MASLRSFMMRMNYLDRSSPLSNRGRRRCYSSATSSGSNPFGDPNNNVLLLPIVNPLRKRRKVSALIYKPLESADGRKENEQNILKKAPSEQCSPQLAVQIYERLDVKLRSEPTIPVSTERFLTFSWLDCRENSLVSAVYSVPRMVPVSIHYSTHPHYDTVSEEETLVYCTTIEFRRRYAPVAWQTNDQETNDPDQSATYVSCACFFVSDY